MTVLVVPGAFTRADAFDDFAARLTEALAPTTGPARVVDLPARGARLPQLDRGGLAEADRTLDREVDRARREGRPVVLVGHSLGALLCLRASRRHSVDALVLLMPAPPGGLLKDLARLAFRDPLTATSFAALAVTTLPVRALPLPAPRGLFTDHATAAVRDASRRWRTDESWLLLVQLLVGSRRPVTASSVPTFVVAGTQDGLVPPATVGRLAARLGAELRELPVAHNFNEEPEGRVVGEEVLDWLQELLRPENTSSTSAQRSSSTHHDRRDR